MTSYRPLTAFVGSMHALTDVMSWTSLAVMTSRCQDHTESHTTAVVRRRCHGCHVLIASSVARCARRLLACHQLSVINDISPYSDVTLPEAPPTALRGAEHCCRASAANKLTNRPVTAACGVNCASCARRGRARVKVDLICFTLHIYRASQHRCCK